MGGRATRSVGRPDRVKVLTMTYTIQWLNEDEWFQARLDDGAVGVTERDKCLISMRADGTVNEDSMRATLFHELLHCVTESSRFPNHTKAAEDVEELYVALVAPILLHTIQENPQVLAYLLISE